jgi:enamine deaminase RidA (YjgF/YER057c/UK114 family)
MMAQVQDPIDRRSNLAAARSVARVRRDERVARFGSAVYRFVAVEVFDNYWTIDDLLGALLGGLSGEAVRILHVMSFTRTPGEARYLRSAAEAELGAVAHTVWVQPPASGASVAALAWYADEGLQASSGAAGFASFSQAELEMLFVHASGPRQPADSPYDEARGGFDALCRRLDESGWRAEDLLRIWIGVPGITEHRGPQENYQQFNLARKHCFTKHGLCEPGIPPASTAIGTRDHRLILTALACRPLGETKIVFLDNPCQVPAYHYDAGHSRVPPLFSRGAAVVNGRAALVFISGTASIVGPQSVHLGDIALQTRQTLTNIETLLAAADLPRRAESRGGPGLESLVCATIYVKRRELAGPAIDECRSRLAAGTPLVVVEADVCREELLVEIEAIAIT